MMWHILGDVLYYITWWCEIIDNHEITIKFLENSSAHFVVSFYGLLLCNFFLPNVWSKSMVSLASQRHPSVIRKYSMMNLFMFPFLCLNYITFLSSWTICEFFSILSEVWKKWFVFLPFIFVLGLSLDILTYDCWFDCQNTVSHVWLHESHVFSCSTVKSTYMLLSYLSVHYKICCISVDKCIKSKDF
jgi:hypothetical protein